MCICYAKLNYKVTLFDVGEKMYNETKRKVLHWKEIIFLLKEAKVNYDTGR